MDSHLLPAPLTPRRMVVPRSGVPSPPGDTDVVGGHPRMQGCQYHMTSYDEESGGPDFSPVYGTVAGDTPGRGCPRENRDLRPHAGVTRPAGVTVGGGDAGLPRAGETRLLEYVGAPVSARLLSGSPEYWQHHLGHEKMLAAALQLQCDAGLILSNVQVLQKFVTSLNRTSSEVMRVAFGRAPFSADAMQQVVPSYRVHRAVHYLAAMGLWRPPCTQGIRGPLPSATCNACMSCSDCFPDLPQLQYGTVCA